MKKRIIIYLTFPLLMLVCFSMPSQATKQVYKVCDNCHTMHASQNGEFVRGDTASVQGAGTGECLDCHAKYRAMLLKLDCIGCHATNPTSGVNITTINGGDVPQVAHSTAATTLAGGNFTYVFTVQNRTRGHNVHGFGANIVRGDLTNTPPGYNPSFDPSPGYDFGSMTEEVQCAGKNGCHGNRNQVSQIEAMRGAHHADDTVLKFGTLNEALQAPDPQQANATKTNGDRVGLSYRFLMGIRGGEHNKWEGAGLSAASHNEYKGDTNARGAATMTWANIGSYGTISQFCAECHGDYHGTNGTATSSPWIRHPSDILLPNAGEFTPYTVYDAAVTIPIARPNLSFVASGSTSQVRPGTDIITCISCHRAHASPNYKILRWDFKSSNLDTAISGCAKCHASKN